MPKKDDNRPPSQRELLAEQSNLTHAQLAIWLAQRDEAAGGRFNRVLIFDLDGRVDSSAFQRAFGALVEAHDVLRTVVDDEGGIPQRRLLPAIDGGLSLLDFSAEPNADATLDGWLRERCGTGFEAGQPLFQSALVRLADQRWAWYLNQHQMITDGLSIALICRRMAEFYSKAVGGRLDTVDPFPAYQEYVGFERRHRQAPVYAHTRAYWEAKLAEPLEAFSFYGHPNSVEPVAAAADWKGHRRVEIVLGAERTKGLRELCRDPAHFLNSLGFSQFMAFTTLLFAFVHHATGNQRLRIGAPFDSRSSGRFEDTVGLFSESCPLSLEIATDDTLHGMLRRLMKEVRSVLMHAQPGVSCAVADHPCQISLDYLSVGCSRFRGLGSRIRQANTGCGASHTLLNLQVLDFDSCDSIVLQFDLHPGAFSSREANLLAEQFPALVDIYLDNPEISIGAIELPMTQVPALDGETGTSDVAAEPPLVDA